MAQRRPRSGRTPIADALAPWLNALFGAEPDGALLEIRYPRRGGRGGWGQDFFGIREPVADYVFGLVQQTDVYIGVAPRTKRDGTLDAIERVHAVWADVDTPEALAALRSFHPRPAIVVRSGQPDHVHAYWPLWPPAGPDAIRRANRRLAHALGADMAATDAARIMRPPGTLNHKTDPPAPVELAHLEVQVFALEEVVGQLRDPEGRTPPHRDALIRPRVDGGDEQLLRRAFRARNGTKLEALYRGDTTGYHSHSEADLALCSHLAFWTDGDVERIDALFRTSGLMRPKWERADYRKRTIGAAIGDLREAA
jgi:NrS-1  polymerase HBD domain